jgi:hypothetical protein
VALQVAALAELGGSQLRSERRLGCHLEKTTAATACARAVSNASGIELDG